MYSQRSQQLPCVNTRINMRIDREIEAASRPLTTVYRPETKALKPQALVAREMDAAYRRKPPDMKELKKRATARQRSGASGGDATSRVA